MYIVPPSTWHYPHQLLFQDAFVSKAKKRVESINESDLWVDGVYMTEKAMNDEGFQPSFGWIKRCSRYVQCTIRCNCNDTFLQLLYDDNLRSRISAIKAECQKRKGWIRRLSCSQKSVQLSVICFNPAFPAMNFENLRKDRYEKHLNVYWVEGQMSGRRLMFVGI